MGNLTANLDKSKGEELLSKLPRGWSVAIRRNAALYNEQNPDKPKLPTNLSHICKIVRTLQVDHPIWPLVDNLVQDSIKSASAKKKHTKRLQQLLKESA